MIYSHFQCWDEVAVYQVGKYNICEDGESVVEYYVTRCNMSIEHFFSKIPIQSIWLEWEMKVYKSQLKDIGGMFNRGSPTLPQPQRSWSSYFLGHRADGGMGGRGGCQKEGQFLRGLITQPKGNIWNSDFTMQFHASFE